VSGDPRYGLAHQRLRKRVERDVALGGVLCARCGGPIGPGQKWHLDHTDDGSGYLGAAHEGCNVSASNRRQRRWLEEPLPLDSMTVCLLTNGGPRCGHGRGVGHRARKMRVAMSAGKQACGRADRCRRSTPRFLTLDRRVPFQQPAPWETKPTVCAAPRIERLRDVLKSRPSRKAAHIRPR
jgi:hypothetical protein